MNRRKFITLLGGAAAAWPLAAWAQPERMPVVGFLNGASPTELASRVAAFRDGLREKDYLEGQSVAIEYRWGLGQYERLPDMAADLARHRVAVIAATGGVPSVRAANAATSEIPIVFTMGGDPVAFGLVASLNRPGGNVTGVTLISGEIVSSRIALLRDLLPRRQAAWCSHEFDHAGQRGRSRGRGARRAKARMAGEGAGSRRRAGF
jgi:putative ABC transport system substrate-binding protein